MNTEHPPVDSTETALTVADLEATPDGGRRYELVDGQLVVTAAPVPHHQAVVGRLFNAFER